MADTQDTNGAPKVPPKLVIRPQGDAAGAGSAPPATVRMRVPAQEAGRPAEGQKKATTRIPLNEAIPPAAAAAPRAINVRPSAPPGAAAGAAAVDDSGKRKTSRISLDAVLGPEGDSSGDGGPKTIRLKRPSEAATVRVGLSAPVAPLKGDTAAISSQGDAKKGTQVLAAVESEEEAAASRKKTIRVKRAVEAVRVDAGTEQVAAGSAAFVGEPAEDRPHGFFVFTAVAAVLVGLVLAYVLAAQAFGPNTSLTQLSYGAPGLDLPWWGRITGRSGE